eukprot:g8732.t1
MSLQRRTALCQEEYCKVTTQTRDHEFITAQVVIQYSVIPSKAKEAIYKLVQQELGGMLRFGKKDEISLSIREQLTDYLKSYGFAVHSLEMTELTVSPEVMHALNEAQKQRRNCDTARVDMAKLRVEKVREAEAEALSAELYGRRLSEASAERYPTHLRFRPIRVLQEECQQLILQAASDEALCSSFEGARREQAIEEPDGSAAAGLVLGKAGPSQHSMS